MNANDTKQLRRGMLGAVVLATLDEQGEAYGLELVKQIKTRGLTIVEGTLYPILNRLERGKYIKIQWNTNGQGHPKKYATITPAGRAELAELRREATRLITIIEPRKKHATTEGKHGTGHTAGTA